MNIDSNIVRKIRSSTELEALSWIQKNYDPEVGGDAGEAILMISKRTWKKSSRKQLLKRYLPSVTTNAALCWVLVVLLETMPLGSILTEIVELCKVDKTKIDTVDYALSNLHLPSSRLVLIEDARTLLSKLKDY